MAKESALYQPMKAHVNGITNSGGEYQEIVRKPNEYSGTFDKMKLPEEARLLINRYVSEQNMLSHCMGCLHICLGFQTTKRYF